MKRLKLLTVAVTLAAYSAASAQTEIPSAVVMPTQEALIIFSHKGELISVGRDSGRVQILGTAPDVPPNPNPTPPSPLPDSDLTPFAKTVYNALYAAVADPMDRINGAKAMIRAIDSTVAQTGGLGLTGQQVVNAFATNCSSAGVNTFFKGWDYGSLLETAKIVTDEDLLRALQDTRKAMEAVR